jgi:hypothetical protein
VKAGYAHRMSSPTTPSAMAKTQGF